MAVWTVARHQRTLTFLLYDNALFYDALLCCTAFKQNTHCCRAGNRASPSALI
jgi:hypothetical protein